MKSTPDAAAATSHAGRVGAGTVALSLGLGIRGLVLAIYLVLVSRWLGPGLYGTFTGWLAAAAILGCLSGWGASQLMTEAVSTGRAPLAGAWKSAVGRVVLTGAGVCLLALAANALSVVPMVFVLLAVSEFILFPLAQLAVSALVVAGRNSLAAVAVCFVPACRLLALLFLAMAQVDAGLMTMAGLHVAGTLAGALAATTMAVLALRLLRAQARSQWIGPLRQGSAYVVATLAAAAYLELDKVILLALLDPEDVGRYALASRMAAMAAMPVFALSSIVLPRLFQLGAWSGAWSKLLRTLGWAGLAYGLFAGAAVVVLSGVAEPLFGARFAGVNEYLLGLVAWPALFYLHQLLGCALVSAGQVGARSYIESGGVAVVAASCILLAGAWGAWAAIAGLMLAEVTVIVLALYWLRRTNRAEAS